MHHPWALRRPEHSRQEGAVAQRGGEQAAVVVAGGGVPVPRARRVRPVRGERLEVRTERGLGPRPVASKAPRKPVMGERNGGHSGRILWLVVTKPAKFGGGERRDRHQTGPLGECLGAELIDEV